MLKFVIVLTAVTCTLAATLPKGMLLQFDGRIVDGDPAAIKSFPWQISLQRGGYHSCGGSIYSEKIIVTAAHCLQEVASLSVLKVRVGSSFWISGGLLVDVAAFKNHELYNPDTMAFDIAVIRLNTSLTFSSTIKPIRLGGIVPENGTAAVVSGWGATKFGSNTIPTQLKYVNLRIISRQECSSKYGFRQISKTMICTYNVNKDACQGDSGGPLVSNGVLVGVVSWGIGCAFTDYPGVYSDVAELRSWIEMTANSI